MDQSLILALIENAALLLAMVVVFDFLSARKNLLETPWRQAMVGVAVGTIGIAMIRVSVAVEAGIIFDTRSVLLAVTGFFLGIWPTVIAVVMTGTARLLMGGAGLTGVAVIVASGAIGLAWRRVRRRPPESVTWRDLYAMGLVVHAAMVALMFTLPPETALRVVVSIGVPVMLVHPAATVALGLLFVQRIRFHRSTGELAEREAQFRLLAESARDLIFLYEFQPERRYRYVSPAATALTGYTPEEHYADPELTFKIVHPEDRPRLEAAYRGELPPDAPVVLRWIRKDGAIYWAEARNTYRLDDRGVLIAVEGIVRDISDTKQAEFMIRLALKAANQGLYDLDVQTGESTVSEEYARMLGFDPASFRETHDAWIERMHPDDVVAVLAAYEDYLAGRIPEYRVEFRQRNQDGEWVWILSLGSIVTWDASGKPLRMLGTHTDITALKVAEQQTREARAHMARLFDEAEQARRVLLAVVDEQQATEQRLLAAQKLAQSTLDALRDHICVLDENGKIIAVNSAWREFGAANEADPDRTLTGAMYLSACDAASDDEAEQARSFASALRDVLEGRRDTFSMEYPCHSPDEQRWFQTRITRFAGRDSVRVVVAHENITVAKQSEHELQRLAQILEASQAVARVGGWDLDLENDRLFWTEEAYRICDTTPAEYTPSLSTAIGFFAPESVATLENTLQLAIEQGAAQDVELELVTASGRRKWVHLTTSATTHEGRTVRVTCAIQDVTGRKRAEQERLDLTAQLHHSQKLESLGSLAGGVAHDINNVLAAILSLASSHRKRMADDDPLARSLDMITDASVRGRSVVRSLLYFARTEVESRSAVDLNAIARDVVQLLESTTLKRFVFRTQLEEPLPPIDGDEAAISHAVMNLCLNSLDAMPDRGVVTIRTRVRPDGFVEITVRDSGTGMTAAVREKAMEPFFTTKPSGKGSGLGLATVYGTVKAHNGQVEILSEPGKGTEVILAFEPGTERLPEPVVSKSTDDAGKELPVQLRILLVDDDELIRVAIKSLLEMEGHEVHEASGGGAAIAHFEEGHEFDLVILDVNMPGLTGPETLPRLLELRPEQPILMCSGHGGEDMSRAMHGHATVLSIQKPFTFDELESRLGLLGLKL